MRFLVSRFFAYTAIAGCVILTLALGATFGIIGLATGLLVAYIAKPVIQDML
jgi:hypothetical protein